MSVTDLYSEHRSARMALQRAIAAAKVKAVLGKLHPWVPPFTEQLDPEFLGRITFALFPANIREGRGSAPSCGP